MAGGYMWQKGMHCKRRCTWWGDIRGRGCACQWRMCGGGHAWCSTYLAGETASEVGVTHPTGMHSCCCLFLNQLTIERCEGCKKVKRFLIKCSGCFDEINRWPIRYKQTSRGHFSPHGPIQFHAFFCNNLPNSRLVHPPPSQSVPNKKKRGIYRHKDPCVFSINDLWLSYGTVSLSSVRL